MTPSIPAILRSIDPRPGFLLTYDQMETMQQQVRALVAEFESVTRALASTDPLRSMSNRADGTAYEFTCMHCGTKVICYFPPAGPEFHTDTCIWAKAVRLQEKETSHA